MAHEHHSTYSHSAGQVSGPTRLELDWYPSRRVRAQLSDPLPPP